MINADNQLIFEKSYKISQLFSALYYGVEIPYGDHGKIVLLKKGTIVPGNKSDHTLEQDTLFLKRKEKDDSISYINFHLMDISSFLNYLTQLPMDTFAACVGQAILNGQPHNRLTFKD